MGQLYGAIYTKTEMYFDKIFIIGYTRSYQNDNFQCSQGKNFLQSYHIFVSVYE